MLKESAKVCVLQAAEVREVLEPLLKSGTK
jgi:hypothetical protein